MIAVTSYRPVEDARAFPCAWRPDDDPMLKVCFRGRCEIRGTVRGVPDCYVADGLVIHMAGRLWGVYWARHNGGHFTLVPCEA